MRIHGDQWNEAEIRRPLDRAAQGPASARPQAIAADANLEVAPRNDGTALTSADGFATSVDADPPDMRSPRLTPRHAAEPMAGLVLQSLYPGGTATAPVNPPGSALERLIALAARVTHSLLPSALFVPNLAAATPPPPAPIPADLLKVCGKDERRATSFAASLGRLQLSDEERSRVQDGLCRLIKSSYGDRYVLEALEGIQNLPDHARQFESFTRLAAMSNPSQGLIDLNLANQKAPQHGTTTEDAVGLLVTLRETDPGRKSEYPSYDDLSTPLTYVLDARDPADRARRLENLARCQKGKRTPSQALRFATALDALTCDDTQRSQVSDMLRSMLGTYTSTRCDADLAAAVAAVDGKEAASRFRMFESLLDECKDPARGLADYRLAEKTATTRSASLQEVADHVLALRQAEPSRKTDYRSFTPLEGALEHVMEGSDAATRAQARERLIALQCGRRHTVEQVVDLDRILCGLKIADAQRDGVRSTLSSILSHATPRDISALQGVLPLMDGKSDAAVRFATLEDMYEMDRRQLQPAIDDYKLADDAGTRHGQPFSSVAARLLELRKSDPNRKEDYPSFANLRAPLDQVLENGGDQARDSLQALQVNHRTPQEATPHAIRLQKLPCTADDRAAITRGYRKVLKRFDSRLDETLLKTLDRIEAPGTEMRERFDAWMQMLDLSKRPQQALHDLEVAVDAAARTGRPFADAATTLITLRKADPGRRADYPTFAELSTPLLDALQSSTPVAQRTADLAALQAGGRTPTEAFAHDQSLLNLKCDSATQIQVRAEYQALLRKTGTKDDVHLRALLDILATRPAPLDGIRAFRRIFDVTKRAETTLTDFKATLAAADRSGVPLEEMIDHLVGLRKADPTCHAEYPTFARLDEAFDFLLGTGTPGKSTDASTRLADRQELVGFMTGGRGLNKALPHAQAFRDAVIPDAQRDSVGSVYRGLVKRTSDDPRLLDLLGLVDGQADAQARMEEIQGLYKACKGKVEQVVTDYRLILDLEKQMPSVARAEMVEHAVKMRYEDPRRKDSYFCPLAKALPTVFEATNLEARTERRDSYVRLLKTSQESEDASRELTWIVNTADAGEDMATRTRKMVRLREGMPYRQHESIKTLYEQVQEAAKQEPQGWFGRLLHLPRTFERIAGGLLKKEKDAQSTATFLGALERGRFEGESYKAAYGRLKEMLKLGQVGRENAPVVAGAFESAVTAGPVLGAGPQERWTRFEGVLREYQSASCAAIVWQAMAGASTSQEAETRHSTFNDLRSLYNDRIGDAITVFRALTDDLEPSESVAACLPTMRELCASQRPDMAAATYRSLRTTRNVSPGELKLLTQVFSHAGSAAELELLNATVTLPVSDESLEQRANVLNVLLASDIGVSRSVDGYRVVGGVVGKEQFQQLAPALATIAGILRSKSSGDTVKQACDLLTWARDQHFEAEPDITLPEALTELGSNLLMSGDAEAARQSVLNLRDRRRKERLSGGASSRVDVGWDEISVGGVRVKVRRNEGEAPAR